MADMAADAPAPLSAGNTCLQAKRWLALLVLAPIVAGLVWRTGRLALDMPLWDDEAPVAVVLWDRPWSEVLRPLERGQVAPPLFVLLEWVLVHALGPSEFSLRVAPWLLGSLGLMAFALAARIWLRPAAACLATGVLAVGYYAVRHTVELKPYGIDMLWASVLLALAGSWLKRPERISRVWWLAALAPLATGMSFPSVFVGGGVCAVLLWRSIRQPSLRLPAAALACALAVSFLGVQALSGRGQYDEHGAAMRLCWADAFPPADPGQFLTWLVQVHTGNLFAHPVGGKNGGSTATFLLFAVGGLVLWRRRQRLQLAVLLAPFALTFVAAALQRYPYGGSARISMHLAPAIALLAGAGGAWAVRRCRPNGGRQLRTLTGVCAVFCVMAVSGLTFDVLHPAKTPADAAVRREIQRLARAAPAEQPVLVLQSRAQTPTSCIWYLERSFGANGVRWGAQAADLERLLAARRPAAVVNLQMSDSIDDWIAAAGVADAACRITFDQPVAIMSSDHPLTRLELALVSRAAVTESADLASRQTTFGDADQRR